MEEALFLILILLVAGIVLYPVLRRYMTASSLSPCRPCGEPVPNTPGVCFPGTTFPVKGGLIDLRHCSDEVYILGDRNKVNFISINP